MLNLLGMLWLAVTFWALILFLRWLIAGNVEVRRRDDAVNDPRVVDDGEEDNVIRLDDEKQKRRRRHANGGDG